MNRIALTLFGCVLTVVVSDVVMGQESQRFNGTQIQNNTGQVIDVVLVGRQSGVIDRNSTVLPGGPRPTSQGYLYGGWRAVCWSDSDTGEFLGSQMVEVNRHNQVISIQLSQRIYLLPAYSCSGSDPSDQTTIRTRQNNIALVTGAFRSHVPKANLIVYADSEWPDGTNASQSKLGYRLSDVQKAIETCPTGPNDTIVVYWNGHGGGPEHQFAMLGNDTLLRSTAVAWIKAKNARLSVLLTDTCARSVTVAAAMEPAGVAKAGVIAPLFYELFIKPRGCVNLNSALPGEYALRKNPLGSYFTLAFASQRRLEELSGKRGYLWENATSRKNWGTVVDEAQGNLTRYFRSQHPNGYRDNGSIQRDQHIWKISVPDTQRPPTHRYHNCKIRNTTSVPLDVVIVGRDSGVLDRNSDIGPGETRATADGFLYGGSRTVAWWRNDNSTRTGIGTKEIVISRDGQVIDIP